MPEICRFYGIVIQMYYADHPPPHFHACYSARKATVDIETLGFIEGQLPARARGLVIEWATRRFGVLVTFVASVEFPGWRGVARRARRVRDGRVGFVCPHSSVSPVGH
jgi:hypothetical protein